MSVDAPSTSTSTSTSTPVVPVLSAAAQKKEEEAKIERERKYPGPKRVGIVLAAEKKVTSKLLDAERGTSEKVFLLNGLVVLVYLSFSDCVIGLQELGRRDRVT